MTRIIETGEFLGKRFALFLWLGPDDVRYAAATLTVEEDGYLLLFDDGVNAFPIDVNWLLCLDEAPDEARNARPVIRLL